MKIQLFAIAMTDMMSSYEDNFPDQRRTRIDYGINGRFRIEHSIKQGEEYLVSVDYDKPSVIIILDERAGRRRNTAVLAESFAIPPMEEIQEEMDKDRWDFI